MSYNFLNAIYVLVLLSLFQIYHEAYANLTENWNDSHESTAVEHELQLFDCPLIVNKTSEGEIKVIIDIEDENTPPLISLKTIFSALEKHLNKSAFHIFLEEVNKTSAYLSPQSFSNGIKIFYDGDEQIVFIDIPLFLLEIENTSLVETDESENETISPADTSGYLNLYYDKCQYLGSSWWRRNGENGNIFSDLSCDYCLQNGSWTLFGDCDFGSISHTKHILTDTTLVRDCQEENLRLSFGDTSIRQVGCQMAPDFLGFSIDYNRYLFGKSDQTIQKNIHFFLTQPSKVEIFINGKLYKILHLSPGPQNLCDFPPITGHNEVLLKIEGSGSPITTLCESYDYLPSLVENGTSTFSVGCGFPQIGCQNHYCWKSPIFTSSVLCSLLPQTNNAFFLQASPFEAQCGNENIFFLPSVRFVLGYGLLWIFQNKRELEYYFNIDNATDTSSSQLVWSGGCTFYHRKYDNRWAKRNTNELRDLKSSAYINLTKPISNFYASITASGSLYNKNKIGYFASLSLSKNMSCVIASLCGYLGNEPHRQNNIGIVFSISTKFKDSPLYNNTTYDSYRNTLYHQTGTTSEIGEETRVSSSIALLEGKNEHMVNPSFTIDHQRFYASGSINTIKNSQHHWCDSYSGNANLSLGTCLLFADGSFALSRPNQDSFIIAKLSDEIQPFGIKIGNYSSWKFLPIAIVNQPSYDDLCYDVCTENLPIGYHIENTHLCFETNYHTGSIIKLGKGKSYLVTGTLLSSDHTPIKCAYGYLENVIDTEMDVIEFFTNRDGEFQIEDVSGGLYQVHIDKSALQAHLSIADEASSFVECGQIIME